jgi:acyl dehydratase
MQEYNMKYFEDLEVGKKIHIGNYKVLKEEIIEFAKKYDPQYFHIDEEAAKKSFLGSLCASGWHTAAITQRLLVDNYFKDIAVLGSPGGELFRWLKPVCPGEVLSVEAEILEKIPHKRRSNVGIIKAHVKTINQNNDTVMELTVNILIEKKN